MLERSDLSETIRQAVFLESVRQPDILIKANLPKEPNIVEFDDRLISQCLTNLIKNCVESIEGFGIGKIINPTIIIETKISGQYVEISRSDNGKGWPDESYQRLLEPYVTTRDKGTGLGLAIVSKIIEQHDGDMILQDSVPDKNNRIGACVIIRLPLKHDATKGELHLLDNEQNIQKKKKGAHQDALK